MICLRPMTHVEAAIVARLPDSPRRIPPVGGAHLPGRTGSPQSGPDFSETTMHGKDRENV